MQYKVHGTVMQFLEITLGQNEMVYSQTHALGYMHGSVQLNTDMGGGSSNNGGGGSFLGGMFKAAMRTLAGGTLFRNTFTSPGGGGTIGFCPRFPGKIVAYPLRAGETLICRKETFLAAESTVQFDIAFRKQLGGGLFGGEGFILQKVTGPGTVFLDLSGEVIEKILQPGEVLKAHVGHVGVQDASVTFGVELVPGFKNKLFGGDGLFFATLTGPGRVLLQSMPIANLADEIAKHMSSEGGSSSGGEVNSLFGDNPGVGIVEGLAGMGLRSLLDGNG